MKKIEKELLLTLGMVAHAFNSVLMRLRQVDVCEFEASLVYKVSFRTARTIAYRNCVLNPTSKLLALNLGQE